MVQTCLHFETAALALSACWLFSALSLCQSEAISRPDLSILPPPTSLRLSLQLSLPCLLSYAPLCIHLCVFHSPIKALMLNQRQHTKHGQTRVSVASSCILDQACREQRSLLRTTNRHGKPLRNVVQLEMPDVDECRGINARTIREVQDAHCAKSRHIIQVASAKVQRVHAAQSTHI